jgi:hypothetical protein
MRGLIELGALVIGLPCLLRLVFGIRTHRVRIVQSPLPSAPVLMCVVLGVIVLAALGA